VAHCLSQINDPGPHDEGGPSQYPEDAEREEISELLDKPHIGKPEGNFFGSYELVRAQKVDKIEKKEQKVPQSTSNLRFVESHFQALRKKLKKL
jgi:hypothetical protein